MVALEVSLNGKRTCLAGTGPTGVVLANVCWVRRTDGQPGPEEELFLEVRGLKTPEQESLGWHGQQPLKVGDEVRIQIVEAQRVSKPTTRQCESPAKALNAQKRYVRKMAKQFGWKIVTR
ncbi:MAG: hypothetical protein B9S33_06725 [Pedosphaera sp. Tous-C6FEB]|nr:MAG: hypothetical protein B9S33_06725 [Pedosphaera sp. Tous-C6FEB]